MEPPGIPHVTREIGVPLSRFLVSSIKEFKNRHRRKLRDSVYSCLKENTQFRQTRNLSICLEEGDGEEEPWLFEVQQTATQHTAHGR